MERWRVGNVSLQSTVFSWAAETSYCEFRSSQATSFKMTDQSSKANSLLTKTSDSLTGNKTATSIPWDPDCTKFPNRKDVPRREDAPEGA